MKKNILFLFLYFSALDINAQYNENNIKKYWFYRNRLVNYFTSIGSAPGQSLIFSHRNFLSPINTTDVISGGENTLNLGLYIGVLATEYKLLNDNGQDVTNTARELYYALYAFNRLDAVSETYYPDPNGGSSLNGFFIRRDIHEDFISEHPNINYGLPDPTPPENYHVGSGQPMWVNVVRESIEEDILIKGKPDPMSQDNAYGIMLGMALVAKCVPETANYNSLAFQDGQINFVAEARKITHRLMMWIKKHPDWIIRTPAGDFVGGGGGANNPTKFNNNGMSFLFAFGIAMAASVINPANSTDYFEAMTYYDYPIWQLLQTFSGAINICDQLNPHITTFTFPTITNMQIPVFGSEFLNNCARPYNLRMILDLAAIGNSWYADVMPQPTNITEVQQLLQLPNTSALNTTQLAILGLTGNYNWSSYFTLLRQVLHGGVYLYQHLNTEAQLNNAPCDGTFCHSPTDKAPNSWAAERRFTSDLDEQNNGPSFDFGNYHGLDFMLLHNLYYLVAGDEDSEGNTLPQYENLMNFNVLINFPFPFPNFGSQTNPFTVGAFRSITAANTINAVSGSSPQTGDVTYRAGEFIELKPGFEVELGADFEAKIDPYACVGGAYQKTDGSDTSSSLYGMDDFPFVPNNYVPLEYNNNEQFSQNTAPIQDTAGEQEIKIHTQSTPITLHPNPSHSGIFEIQGLRHEEQSTNPIAIGYEERGKSDSYRITVTNVLGETIPDSYRVHHSITSSPNHQLNLSNYPHGIYFVKIQSGEEFTVHKVVYQ